MSHVFKAIIRGDSGCFIYVSVKKGDSRQRTHPVYFINFRKAHYFVVIMTIQK